MFCWVFFRLTMWCESLFSGFLCSSFFTVNLLCLKILLNLVILVGQAICIVNNGMWVTICYLIVCCASVYRVTSTWNANVWKTINTCDVKQRSDDPSTKSIKSFLWDLYKYLHSCDNIISNLFYGHFRTTQVNQKITHCHHCHHH